MFLKYSLQASSVICLAGWVLLFPQILCATTTCSPPDFPQGGNYTPVYTEYEVGMKVTYYCKDVFARFGEDRITCQTSGRWSGQTPFCDSPTKLKNPIATSNTGPKDPTVIIDGSPNTCFRSRNGTSEYVRVFLDRPAPVYAVMLYLPRGQSTFKILLSQDGNRSSELCEAYNVQLVESDWIPFFCKRNDVKAKYITIQVNGGTSSAISLCEIEVYAKEDDWCQDPPENYLPNSQLQVSRSKAEFRCNKGFKAKDGRRVYATCESNRWSRLPVQCTEILCVPPISNLDRSEGIWDIEGTISQLSIGTKSSLQCKKGFHTEGEPLTVMCLENGKWSNTTATCKKDKNQKDPKTIIGIAVGAVVVLVIFILLGLTIYFVRKKSREVVVIYKPSEDNSYSTPPSIGGLSNPGQSDTGYSTIYYEEIQNNQLDSRISPPKPPNIIPRLDRGYSKPIDDRSPYNTAHTNQNSTDLAFGTLSKSSSLYNTMN